MGELAMIIKTRIKPGKRDDVLSLYRESMVPRAEANDSVGRSRTAVSRPRTLRRARGSIVEAKR